jgi:hypothetical protein
MAEAMIARRAIWALYQRSLEPGKETQVHIPDRNQE